MILSVEFAVDSFNDGVEFIHLFFDVTNKLELRTAAVKIVFGIMCLEVNVAVKIVSKETKTAFEGHKLD